MENNQIAKGQTISSWAESADRRQNWRFAWGTLAALAFAFGSIALEEWCLFRVLELLPRSHPYVPAALVAVRVVHMFGTAAVLGWICALIWGRNYSPSSDRANGLGCVIVVLAFSPMLFLTLGVAIFLLPFAWLTFWASLLAANKFLMRNLWKEWLNQQMPEVTQRANRYEEK